MATMPRMLPRNGREWAMRRADRRVLSGAMAVLLAGTALAVPGAAFAQEAADGGTNIRLDAVVVDAASGSGARSRRRPGRQHRRRANQRRHQDRHAGSRRSRRHLGRHRGGARDARRRDARRGARLYRGRCHRHLRLGRPLRLHADPRLLPDLDRPLSRRAAATRLRLHRQPARALRDAADRGPEGLDLDAVRAQRAGRPRQRHHQAADGHALRRGLHDLRGRPYRDRHGCRRAADGDRRLVLPPHRQMAGRRQRHRPHQ